MRIKAIILYLFILGPLFSQQLFEGYDGFQWGTTVGDFLKANSNVTENTDNEDKQANERIFFKETNTLTRVYRFFNNKLYWGRTVYSNPDDATASAIMEKLVETYGIFEDFQEGSDSDNREYTTMWKSLSDTFTVGLEYYENYNEFGRIVSTNLFITYENSRIRKNAEEFIKNKKKNVIEL